MNRPFFRTRYRIIRDLDSGFEAQFRFWWWPFWYQCFECNSSSTVEKCREVCDIHAGKTIEYYDPNNEISGADASAESGGSGDAR